MLGQAQRPFHSHALHQQQSHDEGGTTGQIQVFFVVTGKFTRHGCTPPSRQGCFWQGPRLSWICFRHGQRQHERPSSQVVFCVVSQQRKLCSVGAIVGATACTMPRCCISHGCSCHAPAWCVRLAPCNQVMDIQNVHTLEAPRGLWRQKVVRGPTGESEFKESMVLESCGSKWDGGRTCRRAKSSYRSTQNNST